MANNLYVCDAVSGGKLYVRDPATGAALATVTLGSQPLMAAVSPDGAHVAVSFGNNDLQFVDTATLTPGTLISSAVTSFFGIVWAPDSSRVYCQELGQVIAFNMAGALLSSWVVSGADSSTLIAISPDGTKLYCTCGTQIKQVDTTTGATTGTFGALPGSYGICVSPDGSTLYVSDGISLVWPIPVATGIPGTPGGVGASTNPQGVCVSPDGSMVWCAKHTAGTVVGMATATMAEIHVATVPHAQEVAITPDGATVWATDYNDAKIFPIDTTIGAAGTGIAISGGLAYGVAILGSPGFPAPGPVTVTGSAVLALGPVIVAVGSGGSSGVPPIVGVPTVTGAAVLMAGPIVVVAVSTSGGRTFMTAIVVGPVRVAAVGGRIGPGGFPVPGWRGRWRLTLHNRAFSPKTLAQTMIAELVDARGRRLDQAWNTPATLTFTLDGRSQSAALVQELLHDVVAWRWDDQTGVEQPVFRGVIAQAEDQITTESHTVTYTCHDYAAMLSRRLVTATYTVTGRDQDLIVGDLLGQAVGATSSAGVPFSPASFLPISFFSANPNGSLRGLSGQLRNRTYYGSQNIGTAVDDLSKVANGFDYDVLPSAVDDHDNLRVFYPQQGITRTGIALQYGSTVAALTRTVDSSQYANYVRVLGNNGTAAPTPQLYSDNWMAEAQSSTPTVGLWAADDNDASDTVQSALDEKALGDVLRLSDLEPSYTLVLTPGAYTWGNPNMGDTVPLIVNSGRLNVNTSVRVLGITYDIGDDGQEDVTLTVGRPVQSLPKLFAKQDRSIKALDRR